MSVVSSLKVPEVRHCVFKGLLDEGLCHNAYSIFEVYLSEFVTQCSTQSFHEVAYLSITSIRLRKVNAKW